MLKTGFNSFIIVTQLDPIYTYHFFNEFLQLIRKDAFWSRKEIIILNLPNFNESIYANFIRFYKIYGLLDTLNLSSKVLFHKFVTKRLKKLKGSFLKIGIKIENIKSINNKDFISYISKKNAKIISISAPQIFSKELLNIENNSFYNVHCSPLPSYKGMMPNFWQRYFDEYKTAVTLHKMGEKIDNGEILHQIKFPLSKSISLHQTMITSKLFSAHLINEYFNENYKLKTKKTTKNYFSFPSKEDTNYFRLSGGRFF